MQIGLCGKDNNNNNTHTYTVIHSQAEENHSDTDLSESCVQEETFTDTHTNVRCTHVFVQICRADGAKGLGQEDGKPYKWKRVCVCVCAFSLHPPGRYEAMSIEWRASTQTVLLPPRGCALVKVGAASSVSTHGSFRMRAVSFTRLTTTAAEVTALVQYPDEWSPLGNTALPIVITPATSSMHAWLLPTCYILKLSHFWDFLHPL